MAQALQLKEALRERLPLTVTDLMVKALGLAIRDYPAINCRWDELVYNDFINVGVAVESAEDLLVATVKEADRKSIRQIAEDRRQLVEKAKQGMMTADLCSLTLSNLGMHGIRQFSAIINPPEIAVLAVGAIVPIYEPIESEGKAGTIRQIKLTLSCDHRALNGVQAARFLNLLKGYLEQPASWLVDID
jgi:pyruvate dehydrogenase E2 component (dihydrolipoamide acetyltransferase)